MILFQVRLLFHIFVFIFLLERLFTFSNYLLVNSQVMVQQVHSKCLECFEVLACQWQSIRFLLMFITTLSWHGVFSICLLHFERLFHGVIVEIGGIPNVVQKQNNCLIRRWMFYVLRVVIIDQVIV